MLAKALRLLDGLTRGKQESAQFHHEQLGVGWVAAFLQDVYRRWTPPTHWTMAEMRIAIAAPRNPKEGISRKHPIPVVTAAPANNGS